MATFPEYEATGTGRRRLLTLGLVCLALGLAIPAALPGCGGCRKETPQQKKEREKKEAEERAEKKKKEKPKPDFEVSRLMARPTGRLPAGRSEPLGAPYKPGHWTATTLEAKANNFDFVGDLEIVATDARGQPIPIEGAPFDLTTSCQVTLGKRQRPKPFESILFVPPTHQHPVASCRLNWRKGSRRAWQSPSLLARMPPYQYHLVVIAALPENYAYLNRLSSVKPPTDDFGSNPTKPYYRVALIQADKPDPRRRLPLPSYGLLWTSIASVVWDDAAPDALDRPQQEALLDWLHWGGQLIISGPDTLDKLADSFLAPYLPATRVPGARQLGKDDFKELHRWANYHPNDQHKNLSSDKSVRQLAPPRPLNGVRLQEHPQARFVPGCGKLLVERRLGRGRIVVSAFGLSGRTLRSWQGMDEMFNAFLLRRPPRKFAQNQLGEWEVRWADGHPRLDAGRICNLRYFTRDLCDLPPDKGVGFGTYLPQLADSGPYSEEELLPQGPGVAAWNDANPVADSARTTLQNAAEIEIPQRSFVVWVVAAYLLILVPANWAVFRLINRVEWAWAAAPAIAVACTVVVVRMAQLDIGFARSRTEIAVVELQGDYPRAHVTRYTALYTSLTTSYDFRLRRPDPSDWIEKPKEGDPGALLLPFGNPKTVRQQDRRSLLFRRGADASLAGCSVRSNFTGLVHSEQMVDLGGALSLVETPAGRLQLVNKTRLTLRDVGVVKRAESGNTFSTDWMDTLQPGETVTLRFGQRRSRPPSKRLWGDPGRRQGGPLLAVTNLPTDELSLIDLAQDITDLQPGQVRLVAWLEEQIPGLEVRPAAPQTRFATLVVAHLKYGFGNDPQPDVNALKTRPGAGPETDMNAEKTSNQDG